jgi:hypothetical protein
VGLGSPSKRRAARKPEVLDLLKCFFEDGGIGLGTDIARRVDCRSPRRLTAEVIAREIEAELDFRRYMAEEYNPDRPKLTPDELRRMQETEAETKSRLATMRRWANCAGGDKLLGAVDRALRAEHAYWGNKATTLERELGARFLDGPRDVQAEMVRDWIRNYRQRGDLPSSAPPRR